MGEDKDRSSNRKTSRGHKSSSSSKQHRSGRHKSSSRSTASSGEKSKEKERSSSRSANGTPGAHAQGAGDIHSPKAKSQQEASVRSSGGYSVTSSSSFDPIALANQRTDYYAQQHQTTQQPGAFQGMPSEAPSRGSKKSSGSSSSATPQHSTATIKSAHGISLMNNSTPHSSAKIKSAGSLKTSSKPEHPTAMHMMLPSSAKSRPSSNKSSGVSASGASSGASYEHAVIAHEVVPLDGNGGGANVQEDVSRMAEENRAFRAQLQAQNEAERQRMMEENDRIQRELRENIQRQKEIQEAEKAAKRQKQRQYIKIFLLIVVIAAVGVGAYFGTRSSSATTSTEQNPSTAVTKAPTDGTSSLYDPPNAEECENMERGLPRGNDYEGVLNRQFDVIFYAQVSSDVSSSSTVSANLLSVLEQQIERLLRPEIVGCSTIGRRRRNLLLAEQHNFRELSDFDYLIYDFEVSLTQDTESTCTVNEQNTQPCHVVVASMDVWLQGDEPNLLVRGHIFDLLNNLDLPVTLELESQFDIIEVGDVRDTLNVTSTGAPTAGPSLLSSPRPTSPPPTTGPGNTPSTGSCDFSAYFNDGFYYEHDGGLDQLYVVDCSIFTGTRGLALAIDESTCNFACVGRREPQAFGPFCAGQPSGTTIQLRVNGDNTGSKLYLGTDSNSAPGGPLDCNPEMTIFPAAAAPVTPPTSPPTVQPNPEPTPPPTPPPTPQPTPPPTPPPTQPPAPPTNTPNTGSCDLSEYFRDGFYYEYDGGVDQSYVVDCSIFTGTRGIALAVDENTCDFTCVGRKKPSEIGPFCANKPPSTTMQLTVIGDNTGSKIYLGTDAYGREQQFLQCDPPMEASS